MFRYCIIDPKIPVGVEAPVLLLKGKQGRERKEMKVTKVVFFYYDQEVHRN